MNDTGSSSASGYWIVIPAYNEEATIRDVASRALRQITNVVVVDDGSVDGTADALAGLPVTLLRNRRNSGKAASLWRGFQHALKAGVCGVVTLDGDGQHAPEEIPRLISAAIVFPDHLIIGARQREQRRIVLYRYLANRVADFWVSWAAGAPFEDSQSGFRVYPASLLRRVKSKHGKARSFVFESEILIEATRLGYTTVALPVGASHRLGARRSHFRPVLDITRITLMVAWKLISKGMYPTGLYRSLLGQRRRRSVNDEAVNANLLTEAVPFKRIGISKNEEKTATGSDDDGGMKTSLGHAGHD